MIRTYEHDVYIIITSTQTVGLLCHTARQRGLELETDWMMNTPTAKSQRRLQCSSGIGSDNFAPLHSKPTP